MNESTIRKDCLRKYVYSLLETNLRTSAKRKLYLEF